jgi:hypothetical protein
LSVVRVGDSPEECRLSKLENRRTISHGYQESRQNH